MKITALGLNHTTAPIAVRERAAISDDRVAEAVRNLTQHPNISEAAILSTCNRTEIYCGHNLSDELELVQWLGDFQQLSAQELTPFTYSHLNKDAVNHTFRVASGLDSMVLGEPQILGQMKQAYSRANDAGAIGKILNRLFQHTFSVAKQVRTDTLVGATAVSVAYAAVSLAKRIFTDLSDQTVLLIGAGETIELVARHLKQNGAKHLIVANRSIQRAQNLADEVGSEAITLSQIPDKLAQADIVVASTASTLPILGKGAVERALKQRRHKPMFMVDLAVPRDIEPEVAKLSDVYLYTVDDLQSVVEENLGTREAAAQDAEKIIDLQVVRFMRWLRSLESVPTIKDLRQITTQLQQQELDKAHKRLAAGDDPKDVLDQFARGLTNKYLHEPSHKLRMAEMEGNSSLVLAAKKLFGL
ncbi:MAG: glutamyl-tRNA reductase [Gammaproteobacteria bacterium]|jgi:glutamyl-tRNA reductase